METDLEVTWKVTLPSLLVVVKTLVPVNDDTATRAPLTDVDDDDEDAVDAGTGPSRPTCAIRL